eukprot:5462552-Amphidinium_carterae.1
MQGGMLAGFARVAVDLSDLLRSNSASQVSKAVASSAPVSNALKDSTATATTDTSPGCRGYPERERIR